MSVYVVGNVTVDELFRVESLPQKGASVLGVKVARDLGGKGANQALVMARAGLDIHLVAAVGNDDGGRWLRRELDAEGLSLRAIHDIDGPSDVSIILATPDCDNAIVTTTEAADRLTLVDVEVALSQAGLNDVLVLQGNLSLDMTRNTFEIGKRRGMIAAFNPSPVKAGFTELWSLLDIVILNEGEASELTGLPAEQAANAIRAAGPLSVVVTLGARGCFLADENGLVLIPALPVAAIDSTGAGDTFMAIAIASAASRRCAIDRKAVTAATRAAAVTISKHGTRSSFPTREQIAAFLTA